MPNRNYRNGRNFEYQIMRNLEKEKYICIRAAGSHGVFDVIAYPKEFGLPTIWIQAKKSQLGIANIETYFQKDIEKIRQLPFLANNEFYLYLKISNEGQEKWKIEKDRVIKLE